MAELLTESVGCEAMQPVSGMELGAWMVGSVRKACGAYFGVAFCVGNHGDVRMNVPVRSGALVRWWLDELPN